MYNNYTNVARVLILDRLARFAIASPPSLLHGFEQNLPEMIHQCGCMRREIIMFDHSFISFPSN